MNPRVFMDRGLNLLRYGAYVPTEFFVSPERRFVYISIPKVACTSIKLALFDEGKDMDMNVHSYASRYQRNNLTNEHSDFFTFAFVRNPFDRLISCYEDKVTKLSQHDGRYYFDSSYNKVLINRMFGQCFHSDMSFADFVRLAVRIPDWIADAHFRSQHSMLYGRGVRGIDFVGRFENLSEDWKTIQLQLDLPALGIANRTGNRQVEGMREWSPDLTALVLARYADDFASFGYAGRR